MLRVVGELRLGVEGENKEMLPKCCSREVK